MNQLIFNNERLCYLINYHHHHYTYEFISYKMQKTALQTEINKFTQKYMYYII